MVVKLLVKIFGILFFLFAGHIVSGQSDKEKARISFNRAAQFEAKANYSEAIPLLEEAQRLDPDKFDYPYEIVNAYMHLKDYEDAINLALKFTEHKHVEAKIYELLADAYKLTEQSDKIIATYEAGLKKLPNSGNLYFDLGEIQYKKKDVVKALAYFEKGIEVDPKFISNYYWAALIYCNSSEKVWGLIYAELFLNLERKGPRAEEMSKVLYDTYKSQIRFRPDSAVEIGFNGEIMTGNENFSIPGNIKMLVAQIYGSVMLRSVENETSFDLNSLNRIRMRFVENYFKMGYNIKYPNILFEYQNDLLKAGVLESYNYWLLKYGEEKAFAEWQTENKATWNEFPTWFTYHRLKLDASHKFYSGQY